MINEVSDAPEVESKQAPEECAPSEDVQQANENELEPPAAGKETEGNDSPESEEEENKAVSENDEPLTQPEGETEATQAENAAQENIPEQSQEQTDAGNSAAKNQEALQENQAVTDNEAPLKLEKNKEDAAAKPEDNTTVPENSEHLNKSAENDSPNLQETESNNEPLPLSKEAEEKCREAGLSEDEVDELRRIPNGEKPSPEEYLAPEYIDDHLGNFEDEGCYKIISDTRGEPSGTIGDEGVFVMRGGELDDIIQEADGDPGKLEELLGMEEGYLGDDPYIIRCDDPHNLRMPDGNEPNAWQNEWCPGGTTRGGVDEAVIDPMEEGTYSYKHVFGDEEWKQ